MPHPIENILRTTMEELKQIADVNTVVGTPVVTASDAIIVPVSRISLGFVSGGAEYCGGSGGAVQRAGRAMDGESRYEQGDYPFIGTSVVGVTMQPTAFLTVQNGHVTVLPAESCCTLDRVIDRLPQLFAEAERLLRSVCCRAQAGQGQGAQAERPSAAEARREQGERQA